MTVIGADRTILWFQPDGAGTAFVPFGIGDKAAGMSGKSVPGAGRSPVYGRNEFGQPTVIKINREAPGDLPNATITIYERAQMDILLKALQRGCPINIQTRIAKCGSLNNPGNWDIIDHWANGEVTNYSPGDAPVLDYNGEGIQVEGSVSFTHYIRLVQTALSSLTTTEAQDILSVTGIPDEDCNSCGNGYPGADNIMYFGAASSGSADANLLYSRNGGGSIQTVSAQPFATPGNNEDVSFVAVRPVSQSQLRIVVATNTPVATSDAQYAFADVTYGAEGTTVWTNQTIAGTANNDVVTAMGWMLFDRLYFAAAGDIYVSTNQGQTDPGTAIYTGSVQINGFAKSPDESEVWAFGNSNLILRELEGNNVFEVRTGPSGGGTFHSLVVAGDGTIYAGNGTSFYVSIDKANGVGNWTELYDFGSNKAVKKIQVIGGFRALGGDSQLLRAVVDDTTGGTGAVYLSPDGGATWQLVPTLTNTGYNDAYFSQVDDNKAVIVGDTSGGVGVIHRLAPK